MASPDITDYIDLTAFDRQPADIYTAALQYARTTLPEWTPVTGSIEDAILQASASLTGEVIGAINRLPSGIVEVILQLLGVTRDSGQLATASVEITAIDDFGYTIPTGTRFGYLQSGDDPVLYTFETTEEATIASASTTVETSVSATTTGSYPTLTSGTYLQLISPVPFIDSVQLTANLSAGSEAETDTQYLARAMARLGSLSEGLVTASQMQNHVLATYSDVYRCKAYSRVASASATVEDALVNGYTTLYVSKVGGASLTPSARLVIEEDLEQRSVAGLILAVESARIEPVSVTATVTKKPGYTTSQVVANVEAALNQYLHPDFWDWSEYIYYNEVLVAIDAAEGVDRVVSLSLAPGVGANVTASGSDLRFDYRGSLPTNTAAISVV